MYHYAENNPVRYVDPDGKKIWISEFDKEKWRKVSYALHELQKTQRGKDLLTKLESAKQEFYIVLSDEVNSYDECIIYWNPDLVGYTQKNEKISSITFLGHELGHAEQALDGNLQIMKQLFNSGMNSEEITNYILDAENENLRLTENKIAEQRNEAIRKNYSNYIRLEKEPFNED